MLFFSLRAYPFNRRISRFCLGVYGGTFFYRRGSGRGARGRGGGARSRSRRDLGRRGGRAATRLPAADTRVAETIRGFGTRHQRSRAARARPPPGCQSAATRATTWSSSASTPPTGASRSSGRRYPGPSPTRSSSGSPTPVSAVPTSTSSRFVTLGLRVPSSFPLFWNSFAATERRRRPHRGARAFLFPIRRIVALGPRSLFSLCRCGRCRFSLFFFISIARGWPFCYGKTESRCRSCCRRSILRRAIIPL